MLRAETEVMAGLPVAPEAAAAFAVAKDEMAAAVAELNSLRREPAVGRQQKAEEALRTAILALNEYIASLFTLANEGLISGEGYIPRLDDLTKLLFLAVQQRELRQHTARWPQEALPQHAVRQSDLKQQAVELSETPQDQHRQGPHHRFRAHREGGGSDGPGVRRRCKNRSATRP